VGAGHVLSVTARLRQAGTLYVRTL